MNASLLRMVVELLVEESQPGTTMTDPLLANTESQEQSSESSRPSIPTFVTATAGSTISKLSGFCGLYHFGCGCSQFADTTETSPPHEDVATTTTSTANQNAALENAPQSHHAYFALSTNTGLWQRSGFRCQNRSCSHNILVGSLVLGAAIILSMMSASKPHAKTEPPLDRFKQLEDCAKMLVPELRCPQTPSQHMSSRCTALYWFLGPGRNIALDPSRGCRWDSDFGTLFSLIILRESLGVVEDSWQTTVPLIYPLQVCSWKRIGCNDKGISGLHFNNANLNGTIPSELAGLPHLENFWAYTSVSLVGSIPTELGRMTNLRQLELQQSSLTGTIPSEIGLLTNLESLLLDSTLLRGVMPDQVCALRSNKLELLHANCRGEHAMVHCSCCTSCK